MSVDPKTGRRLPPGIEARVHPRSGKPEYRGRWRDSEGRSRRSRWLATRRLAEAERAKGLADRARGIGHETSDTTTVVEYAWKWLAGRPHRRRTRESTAGFIRNHLEGTPLGGRPLVRVRPSEIQAWASSRVQPHGTLSPSTLRNRLGTVLKPIFHAADLDLPGGLPRGNPLRHRLQLPAAERQPFIPLTVEQVEALAAAIRPAYQAMVVVQAGLGLRLGELLALRVTDVAWTRRLVRIEEQLEQGSLERVDPKVARSRRTVELPDRVAEALARHIEAWPPLADGTLFSVQYLPKTGHRARTVTPEGPITHSHYTRTFTAAVRRAGLPAGTTSHDLRHHYAVELLDAGVPVFDVAEQLGDRVEQVLRVYGHRKPGATGRVRRAIDQAWAVTASEDEEEQG